MSSLRFLQEKRREAGQSENLSSSKTHPKAYETWRAALCPSAHPLQHLLAHRGSEVLGNLHKDNGFRP